MALYQVHLTKAGERVYSKQCNGTCTGAFQGRGFGYFDSYEWDTMTVEISCHRTLSVEFMKNMAKTPLIQSLVPGLEYVSHHHDNQRDLNMITWKFPGCDVLPADQVICAMRIINSWGGGLYTQFMKALREYELTTSEMMVIAMFGAYHPVESDCKPVLYYLPKSFMEDEEYQRQTRHNKVHFFKSAKKQPHAGMLLPLIRGEINPGWQPTLQTGYLKETALLMVPDGDPYRAKAHLDGCPDDGFITVNHPLIHPSEEGPTLGMHSSVTEVADWILQQLGK